MSRTAKELAPLLAPQPYSPRMNADENNTRTPHSGTAPPAYGYNEAFQSEMGELRISYPVRVQVKPKSSPVHEEADGWSYYRWCRGALLDNVHTNCALAVSATTPKPHRLLPRTAALQHHEIFQRLLFALPRRSNPKYGHRGATPTASAIPSDIPAAELAFCISMAAGSFSLFWVHGANFMVLPIFRVFFSAARNCAIAGIVNLTHGDLKAAPAVDPVIQDNCQRFEDFIFDTAFCQNGRSCWLKRTTMRSRSAGGDRTGRMTGFIKQPRLLDLLCVPAFLAHSTQTAVTLWQFGTPRQLQGQMTLAMQPMGTAVDGSATTYIHQVLNPAEFITTDENGVVTKTTLSATPRTIVASASGWHEAFGTMGGISCGLVDSTFGQCWNEAISTTTLSNSGAPTPVVVPISLTSTAALQSPTSPSPSVVPISAISTQISVLPLPTSTAALQGATSPSPSATNNPGPPTKRPAIGAIVGGVVGGLLLIGGILGAIWFRRRQSNRIAKNHPLQPYTQTVAIGFNAAGQHAKGSQHGVISGVVEAPRLPFKVCFTFFLEFSTGSDSHPSFCKSYGLQPVRSKQSESLNRAGSIRPIRNGRFDGLGEVGGSSWKTQALTIELNLERKRASEPSKTEIKSFADADNLLNASCEAQKRIYGHVMTLRTRRTGGYGYPVNCLTRPAPVPSRPSTRQNTGRVGAILHYRPQ
ncbi:hypothetical protein B0H19DRAFT_1083024 [Mycena capillaripes]|nr:hypothetical protein B0H19DRAFT_1083024 [Mycena capillaripes]